jgi:hypothetical protein
VARCPDCGNAYCRECITEHDTRVICSACLRRAQARPARRVWPGWLWLWRAVQLTVSLAVLWLYCYGVGRLLVAIPDRVHQGHHGAEHVGLLEKGADDGP